MKYRILKKSTSSSIILGVILISLIFSLIFSSLFSSFSLVSFADENLELSLNLDKIYYSKFKDKNLSLNVYNWGEYISNGDDDSLDVNKAFTQLTGIKINYTQFDTNESLYAKLKSGGTSYDVIFPSDYMISRMVQEDMLEELNMQNIPTLEHIDKNFLNQTYDPQNKYSLPYTWGTVGIIYNYDMLGYDPDSWDVMWDSDNAGQILQFSNSRDAMAISLLRLGYNVNTEEPRELKQAAEELKSEKPLVQAYVMDQIFDKMQGNEAAIAPYYAGDAVNMIAANPSLRFVIPKEGSNRFVDGMCIPKLKKRDASSLERKEAAEMYINFLNEPEIAKANIEFIQYSTPNKASFLLLDEETRNNNIIYPSDEILSKTQIFVNLTEETNRYIDKLWTEIMSAEAGYSYWAMPLFLLSAIVLSVFITVLKRSKKRRRERFEYDNFNS